MATDNVEDQPQVDPNKNYLLDLVGDGKKFKSPEELAKGKFEADSYVKILERRLDQMRSDYSKLRDDYSARAKLEDLVDQLNKQRQLANEPEEPVTRQPNTIDSSQIESLVSRKIQEHDYSRKQQDNYDQVKSKLQERYGDSYQDAIRKQIADLDITEDELNQMARSRPKMLLKTLGLDRPPVQETFSAPPRTDQRQGSFVQPEQKRTWSYYQDLYRKDPKLYHDRKTAIQMQQDAIALGDAFKDGDYNLYG